MSLALTVKEGMCLGDFEEKYMLLRHNCFGPLFLLVEGLLSTGPTPSSFYLLVEMGLPLDLFPAYRL